MAAAGAWAGDFDPSLIDALRCAAGVRSHVLRAAGKLHEAHQQVRLLLLALLMGLVFGGLRIASAASRSLRSATKAFSSGIDRRSQSDSARTVSGKPSDTPGSHAARVSRLANGTR